MPELVIHSVLGDEIISFSGQPLLHDLIAHHPDAPDRSCGGHGTCGRCAVTAKGTFAETCGNQVLSCQVHVAGDTEVWLPPKKLMTQIETRTTDSTSGCSNIDCADGYGIAVDLGTTTVVLSLIRLSDGKSLSTLSCENPQRLIAADVVGRIESALAGKLGILQTMISQSISQLEHEALQSAGLKEGDIRRRVIAGNTTMLYLCTGRDPQTLSCAPFEADCLFDITCGQAYLPACAGAYVGADITCAILASQMCRKHQTALLIDIGTNGEIALWHNGTLSCCATAAGPAFEGAGISCGTGSVPGAIDRAEVIDGEISLHTICGEPPVGICGSGLIDLTAALLDTEYLDETGCMDDAFVLHADLELTQKDIRQIQLAKGAIAAGIQTLLKQSGISCSDVDQLYIAGGFGSHLNLQSAARIGLIPEELADKTTVLGNASLSGAVQMLLSEASRETGARMARSARCINLAATAEFSDAFIECMLFE